MIKFILRFTCLNIKSIFDNFCHHSGYYLQMFFSLGITGYLSYISINTSAESLSFSQAYGYLSAVSVVNLIINNFILSFDKKYKYLSSQEQAVAKLPNLYELINKDNIIIKTICNYIQSVLPPLRDIGLIIKNACNKDYHINLTHFSLSCLDNAVICLAIGRSFIVLELLANKLGVFRYNSVVMALGIYPLINNVIVPSLCHVNNKLLNYLAKSNSSKPLELDIKDSPEPKQQIIPEAVAKKEYVIEVQPEQIFMPNFIPDKQEDNNKVILSQYVSYTTNTLLELSHVSHNKLSMY